MRPRLTLSVTHTPLRNAPGEWGGIFSAKDAKVPPALAGKAAMMFAEGRGPSGGDFDLWKTRMIEKGWGVATWPKQYGGGGLSAGQARVLLAEMNRIGAFSPIGGMGVGMFG